MDILGLVQRRRSWSAHEKAALLAEVDAAGGKVRLVARRHAISQSLLYNWRSARKAAAVAMGAAEDVAFLPVGIIKGPAPRSTVMLAPPDIAPSPQHPPAADKGGSIEIALPNGTRVSVDAFVNENALSRVLRVMKGLT